MLRSCSLLVLTCLSLRAGDGLPVPNDVSRKTGTLTFYLENDWFGGTDRHYTNGFKIAWLSADLEGWRQQGWRKAFAESLPFVNRPDGQKNFGIAFGQNMYTPQDQDTFVPDPNDRPYAGWAYLEFTFLSKTERVADTMAIQVGMVGRHSYAQDLHTAVHKLTNNLVANGWPYQLHDEVGVNLVYERKLRFYRRALHDRLGCDLVPHLGLSLGNVQTYANTGATLRFGFNLPSDFGVELIRPATAGASPIDNRDPRVARVHTHSFFVFAAGDGRAVARDIFLDGNTFKDSPHVDKRPFVADLSYGAGIVAGAWQVTFTQDFRTREFETQQFKYNEFGSLTVSHAF
ncbi:MAG TPA: lipid A deacylase LpxR family protein [Lacunisphaera sp.]|nr:lipid A deacylase LpxR family protein [Lacunisphaera sp.]